MNANQIHIGDEYAVCPYSKPNNNEFIPNAFRIKAMRVFGEQEPHNKRLTMYVEGYRMDYDGNLMGTNYVRYRVRDVIEDWDEYEDRKDQWEVEQSRIEQERAKREAERRAEYERQQSERERIERNKRQTRDKVLSSLKNIGLTPVPYDSWKTSEQLSFSIKDLQDWLDSLERVQCTICGKTLVKIQLPQGVHV